MQNAVQIRQLVILNFTILILSVSIQHFQSFSRFLFNNTVSIAHETFCDSFCHFGHKSTANDTKRKKKKYYTNYL